MIEDASVSSLSFCYFFLIFLYLSSMVCELRRKKKAISRKDFIFLFLAGAAETGTALKVLLNLNIKHNRFS